MGIKAIKNSADNTAEYQGAALHRLANSVTNKIQGINGRFARAKKNHILRKDLDQACCSRDAKKR